MRKQILNFFLLILQILLNFSLDANHKSDRFFKTFFKKGFKFVSSRKNGIVTLNLDLLLFPMKVDLISEK